MPKLQHAVITLTGMNAVQSLVLVKRVTDRKRDAEIEVK